MNTTGKKWGGRQKGTPNKINAFTKQLIQKLLDEYHSSGTMKDDLNALTSKDRLEVYIKLAGYLLPKPQAVSLEVKTEKTPIDEQLALLAEEAEN